MNTFINFVNRSLAEGETKGGLEASGEIGALLLQVLDLILASLFCSPEMLAGGLTQKLCLVVQDPGAIARDGGLNMIFLNKLANSLGIKLLKL